MMNERLDLLREALPYIQRFKNKTFVVKLSGKVTEDQEQLNSLAEEITLLQQVGIHIAVIHGRRREIQNVMNQETGEVETIDFGHVGDIVQINVSLLRLLLENGYVPVISSLGADEQGNIYNINADTIAVEIAVKLQAEKLILLTDVDGILRDRDDQSSRISNLTAEEADRLVQDRVVSAGMLPKIAAIAHLIRRGVSSAHIINGSRRNALLNEVFTDEGAGTMISLGESL